MTLRDALDRTLLLMRDHVRPETPDDVLLDALSNTEILIVSDEANIASNSAQTAAITAAMLTARSGAAVYLDVPNTILRCPQPPLRLAELNQALLEVGTDLLPERAAIKAGPVRGDPDLAVVLGDSKWRGRARQVVRLNAEPWAALIADGDAGLRWRAHDWPFGGLGAGAFAAGEAFKAAMRKLRRHSTSPVFDETFAPSRRGNFRFAPQGARCPTGFGFLDLVSAGAISQALMFALARIPDVSGDLRAFDSERSDVSNLNRYSLLRLSDVGSVKVYQLARMGVKDISVTPLAHRFDPENESGCALYAPRVLAGVDHIPTRWAIQRQARNWLCVGATSHYSAMASFHTTELPCAGCLHPRDDAEQGLIPTVAFVSFWAGLEMAAFLMRHVGAERLSSDEQQIYFTPLRPEWISPVWPRTDCAIHCAPSLQSQVVSP